MNQSALTVIIAVAAVAVLGLLLRRSSVSSPAGAAAPSRPPDLPDPDDDDDDDETSETAAITSDGWSFVPVGDRDKVKLVPPRVVDPDHVPGRATQEQLGRGDLIAARVKRGAPDHDPWRLEGLGRDHEYRAWRFETEEAARAALDLVARRVVRLPKDEGGEPIAIGDADLSEARRREEELENELANMSDVEELPGGRPDEYPR